MRNPELVTMYHPKLPPDQTIQIARARIGARLASGWEIQPKPEVAKVAAEETKLTEPKRQRRTKSEE